MKTTMKTICTRCLFAFICFLPYDLFSQTLTNGYPANFGIDGDLQSNVRLVGSWNPTGTHDWFKGAATTALGIIDTTGGSIALAHLVTGENYVFNRGMSVPRYSVQDGFLLLDARYGRDYFALSSTGPTADFTTFGASQKNGFDPTTWITTPLGGAVSDKADIIDALVHMRRDGNVINGTSSSHLIATLGASTASNSGNRYFDVEFFCTRLAYDSATGRFSNSGPALTGGHTEWKFNPDGSVQQFGDMSIAFSFTGSDVTEISIWIWVSSTIYTGLNPLGFDFAPSQFYGATPGASYGYAKITANPGGVIPAWGAVNTSTTLGPPWQTFSKSLGSNTNNYLSAVYDIAQLGEAAIDLTSFGIDPVLVPGNSACDPPFKRVLIKSRSSSSFTSALQDFAGPYEFLDAPMTSAAIKPALLSCNNPVVTLEPQSAQAGIYYQWTTQNGNIISNPDSNSAGINMPGKYYLRTSIYPGCTASIDSVIILKDSLRPVATASTSGMLSYDSASTVILYGGDPVASNVITSFGGSQGLLYSWTGPSGFTSTLQNPVTSVEGIYTLTVTEIRNGCTATASTTVLRTTGVLTTKLLSFQANLYNKRAVLIWKVAQNEGVDKFEIEGSLDGKTFSTIGVITSNHKPATQDYSFAETVYSTGRVYYRLKIYNKSGAFQYSTILWLDYKTPVGPVIKLLSVPVSDKLIFNFESTKDDVASISIIEMDGRVILKKGLSLYRGLNQVSIPITKVLPGGAYILQLHTGTEYFTTRFINKTFGASK
jgi:hypothetical protein